MSYFFFDGKCPKCGGPMASMGSEVKAMLCMGCGHVEEIHPDDLRAIQEMIARHKHSGQVKQGD